ncbi:MAG: cobyric acid synthase [Naasia sp.]|nr:cobyric acid synthase [Naasia sp.]
MTAYMLQLFPELTNVNGDAENALVLAQRARWAGMDAEVYALAADAPAPAITPAAIVLGSGVDANLARTREALGRIVGPLGDWIAEGVPVLAVGTGMELLGRSIPLAGETIQGLGAIPGQAVPLENRATGELVVHSPWGPLVGYENHARGYDTRDPGITTLGGVGYGVGNGDGSEGVHSGFIFGTHLHGPVLARNPTLAIAISALAFGEAEDVYGRARADGIADAINSDALRRLGVLAPGAK